MLRFTSPLLLTLALSPLASTSSAATGNIGSRGEELLTLDNGTVKIGIDRAKGAAITWLSSATYPKNLVNSADPGRLIQQKDPFLLHHANQSNRHELFDLAAANFSRMKIMSARLDQILNATSG